MTPAKFSIERILAASTSPSVPIANPAKTTATRPSSAPPRVGRRWTSGSSSPATTTAWAVPSSVAPSAFPNATVLRRIGATSIMRSTPASRSVTVERAASNEPNITTIPSRPGAMYAR